jgi:NtrC-family two-component system response regulator AlgB
MDAERFRALVVDDEKNIRSTLAVCLEGIGGEVTSVAAGAGALEAARRTSFDVAFVDLRLASESGLDLVPKLLGEQPDLVIILITAYASFDTAVEAIKRGAWDFLPKPFTPAQIRHLTAKALERRRLSAKVAALEHELSSAVPEADLDSQSSRMRALYETVARAAPAQAPVLIRGESGTGKGVLARALHAQSPRRAHPFVVVNCPTLSEDLLASELFGHARGAFTGAVRDQAGRVEAADQGTLFLDEIGEIPPGLQVKLLRFLQDKEFERVGETTTRRADVRVVAATNRDVAADVKSGRFREDLLYRLNVVELEVPPLRDRPEDILALAHRFLAFFAAQAKRPLPELSKGAEQALLAHRWPGNVRELRNSIERAVILWPAAKIEAEAFPGLASRAPEPRVGGDFSLDEIEKAHIQRVTERTSTLDEAAAILGIDSSTLWRKRKKYEG